MSLKEDKIIMIDIDWANNYTDYLKGSTEIVKEIDNSSLNLKFQNPDIIFVEDEDYVIIIYIIINF